MKRIELGVFTWQDQNIYEGQDLRACFDKMMIYSDNNCAEAFMEKIGYSEVTEEVRALGLRKTTFISSDGYAKTSANDPAIIYDEKGVYALVILTEKSSWQDVAGIASKIEALRAQYIVD